MEREFCNSRYVRLPNFHATIRFMEFTSVSVHGTKQIATDFLSHISKLHRETATVVGLYGNLGSGKTTFVQFVAEILGVKEQVTSPTFLIVKSYKLKVKSYKSIYHIDCYRIQKPKELLKLGFKEIINNPQNIVLIEWAEKLKKILPKKINWIRFEYGKKLNERKIIVKLP